VVITIMVIEYVHMSDPDTVKSYDTVKSLRNNPFLNFSQVEWDNLELERFKHDKNIIRFEITKYN
jgi:hypothetical protein